MKKYILIILWIFPYLLNAQDLNPYNNIIPPNPYAASLAKYADYPVDLSTGVPQISIPLWNIKCGGIDVPISLSYHASGIPVAETPSYVGLGWTLNAGGVITRSINGIADDGMLKQSYNASGPTEYFGLLYGDYALNADTTNDSQNPYKYWAAAVGKADLEPDMFYYNFCNHAGKFVFDYDGNPHLIPRKNIKIEKVQNTLAISQNERIVKWTVTTDDGLIYYFDEVEKTDMDTKTEAYLKSGNVSSSEGITSEYNSAWYLTKIKMPNSSDSVVFEYNTITTYNTTPVSETYKNVQLYQNGGLTAYVPYYQAVPLLAYTRTYFGQDTYEYTQSTSTITGERLSKIIAPNQTVEFIPGDYRFDLKGDRVLDKVVIMNKEGSIIKQFKLSYNYFASNGMKDLGSATVNTDANTSYRLSLKSVQEYDKNGISMPPYTFEYETNYWLPDRVTSKAQDYWGYYNGHDQDTTLIPVLGANRNACADSMKAGSLEKIIYPTGGYTQFVYEANTAIYLGKQITVGGLRIKEKIDYDPVSKKSLIKQYDYNSSNGTTSGYIDYEPNNFGPYVVDASGQNNGATWTEENYNYSSSSNSALNNGGENVVNYQEVTVTDGDATGIYGKTENYYTKLNSIYGTPSTSTYLNYLDNNKIPLKFSDGSSDRFPYAPAISGAWYTGLLATQIFYKYQNNSFYKIKEIQNTYKNDYWGATGTYNPATDVLGVKVGASATNYQDDFGLGTIVVQPYFIPSRNVNLTKTVETDYDDSGNPTTQKVTNLKYESSSPYIYISEKDITDSHDDTIKTTYKYPIDYYAYYTQYAGVTENYIDYMVDKNMLKYVVEKKEEKNGNVISAIHNHYTDDVNPKLSAIYKAEIDNPIPESSFSSLDDLLVEGSVPTYSVYKKNIIFDKYDDYGNLLQYHAKDGMDVCYVWGYNNTYPIAEIKNATYSEVETAIETVFTVSDVSALSNLTVPDETKLTDGSLQQALPNAQVTTYTYYPLIGMKSKTDPRGVTTYYNYDDFGRLQNVKDNDSHTLTTYDYHYLNN